MYQVATVVIIILRSLHCMMRRFKTIEHLAKQEFEWCFTSMYSRKMVQDAFEARQANEGKVELTVA